MSSIHLWWEGGWCTHAWACVHVFVWLSLSSLPWWRLIIIMWLMILLTSVNHILLHYYYCDDHIVTSAMIWPTLVTGHKPIIYLSSSSSSFITVIIIVSVAIINTRFPWIWWIPISLKLQQRVRKIPHSLAIVYRPSMMSLIGVLLNFRLKVWCSVLRLKVHCLSSG